MNWYRRITIGLLMGLSKVNKTSIVQFNFCQLFVILNILQKPLKFKIRHPIFKLLVALKRNLKLLPVPSHFIVITNMIGYEFKTIDYRSCENHNLTYYCCLCVEFPWKHWFFAISKIFREYRLLKKTFNINYILIG